MADALLSPSLLSLVAQFPLVGIFVWFSLHRDKLAASERKDRDDAWQAVMAKSDESQAKISASNVTAIREIAREHREAQERLAGDQREQSRKIQEVIQEGQERLLKGQNSLLRGNAKVTGLLVARMTDMTVGEAKALVTEIMRE